MPIATTTASPWPVRCAYLSAAIFTAASGGTNLLYGWQKGTDLPSSLVWSGVAGAVAIVFALSWPALIRSVDAKRYSAALIALVAMILSGACSVTAALGSAAGGRANAAASEAAQTDARNKAQAAYDGAKAELDALAVARPAAEIQRLIETTKAELAKLPAGRSAAEVEAALRGALRAPQRFSCAMVNGSMALSCPKLDGELARALQRDRLEAKIVASAGEAGRAEQRVQEQRTAARAAMDKASGELARIQPGKQANSDAVALSRYLDAVGLRVTPERLSDFLVLLAVLVIESGGGLALAVGIALQEPALGSVAACLTVPAGHSDQLRTAPVAAVVALPATSPDTGRTPLGMASATRTNATETHVAGAVGVKLGLADEILDRLRLSGGRTEGVRRLAGQLGRARSTVSDECHRLVEAGHLTMTRGRRGTVLALPAGRPN